MQVCSNREWYDQSRRLLPLLDTRGATCVTKVTAIHKRILDRIERSPTDVYREPPSARLIGGRARLVIASSHGPRCHAAEEVAGEIARHIPQLADQRKLNETLTFAALAAMPIEWTQATRYTRHRVDALARITARDPDD